MWQDLPHSCINPCIGKLPIIMHLVIHTWRPLLLVCRYEWIFALILGVFGLLLVDAVFIRIRRRRLNAKTIAAIAEVAQRRQAELEKAKLEQESRQQEASRAESARISTAAAKYGADRGGNGASLESACVTGIRMPRLAG